MRQKPKIIEKEVGYLQGGQVRYVSVVDHGANQEPFRIIKRTNTGDSPMRKIRLLKKSKQEQAPLTTIASLTFQKSVFAERADVETYLETNGWEGFALEEQPDAFVAKNSTLDAATVVQTRSVEVENGLISHVAELKSADEDENSEDTVDGGDAEDTPEGTDTSPDAEPADDSEDTVLPKFDSWAVYTSGDTTFAGVLSDGMNDGLPPGIDDVLLAFRTVTANVLKCQRPYKENVATLTKAATDYAALVAAIAEKYAELAGSEDAAAKKFVTDYAAFIGEPVPVAKSADTAVTDHVAAELKAMRETLTTALETAQAALTAVEELKAVKAAPVLSRKSLLVDAPVADTSTNKSSGREAEELAKDEAFLRSLN